MKPRYVLYIEFRGRRLYLAPPTTRRVLTPERLDAKVFPTIEEASHIGVREKLDIEEI